jgi:hypothetical protein
MAMAIVVSTPTGCGGMNEHSENTSSSTSMEAARARLRTLPSSEDTEKQLQKIIVDLGDYIAALVPGTTWDWYYDRTVGNCAPPYTATDGIDVYLRKYGASKPIPDDVWPKVLERVERAAASVGATQRQVFHDEPGNHEVLFVSPEGTELQIGSRGAAIAAHTGCRLRRSGM